MDETLRYFRTIEFACKHCGANRMEARFLLDLDELRHRYGKPLIITSGYRCPEHNARVSNSGLSGPHTTGCAADIRADGADAYTLLRLALEMEFTGIGISQKGHGRFIHLDKLLAAPDRPRPVVWSY